MLTASWENLAYQEWRYLMGKRRKAEEQPLSEYWKPPADSGLKDGTGEPVACIATTFEFDAGFFEAELLPRFLGLRFDHTENERTFIIEREEALSTTRVGVLVDVAKFDPRQTTLQWDQLSIQVPRGIQHGKLTLLVWERLARLIVGSANLTRPGYRRNRELFAALDFFDGSDSAPLRLLRDALDFIDTLCGWSRALPSATQRILETGEQVRTRVGRWSSAAQDLKPRERPRVGLVVGHPAHMEGPSLSVLDQLFRFWLPRRIRWLTVMTPFVGQGADRQDPVLSRMRDLPMARDAEGWLVVPRASAPEGRTECIVPLPKRFGQGWRKLLSQGAHVLPVPVCVEGVDERPRDLHAKAILIQGDHHDLLMIGSSNFTPNGMGVSAFNCEANLVFEDWADAKQEGVGLEDRLGLPVPWESAVGVDEVLWQDPNEIPEDAPPSKPALPGFFSWASYSQRTGEIRVGLDRSQHEPSVWSVNLTGQSAEHAVKLFSRAASLADETSLCFTLDEKARGVHLTALRVSWQDEDEMQHEAFLPVSVENRDVDLLPPEEFRNLTVEGIIECLLSGREPAEWVEREDARRKRSPSTDAAIESLRAVDTSSYVLYRVRRFGRALAAMADRIARTPPTPDAIRYRLLRDPLGPIHLAETLSCDGEGREGGRPAATETGYRLYALAELVLILCHVSRHIRRVSRVDRRWITPLFREAGERLRAVIQQVQNQAGQLPDDLKCYIDAVFSENARLFKMKEE
jgi:hypothetical protein